ncbi:MAG: nickel pincer cofactor biosynthesis protein LarC [Nitrospiraceae bacterium]|nr:nickel pincer cofactor biosynthesis protein LarC [Nitrospiraceae bacterium]
MRIAYFQCPSGISGDMCIGALLSAGAPAKALERALKKIPLGFKTGARDVRRMGLAALKFDVGIDKGSKPLGWAEMKDAVEKTPSLREETRRKGLSIIKSIFEAEAKVHGIRHIEDVHLHELGSPDTVVDVLGTLVCLDALSIDAVYSSPLNLGSGHVHAEHGVLPVPAPATALLLKGVPVYSSGIPYELTTPTGAALIKSLSSGFGPMPAMKLEASGLGAGLRDLKECANVLRVFIGEAGPAAAESVTVLETNIDDMNPQIYGHLMEKLLKAGALDVFLTPVIMKKSRPGTKVSVLSEEKNAHEMKRILFRETTTLGVRCYPVERTVLHREIKTVDTEFGPVRFKISSIEGKAVKSPEYDDCVKAAKKTGLPLREVIDRLKKTGKNRR